MNTIPHTQTIWIASTPSSIQNNLDEITWCKNLKDAKLIIRKHEIDTVNSHYSTGVKLFIKPISKIIVEDVETYGEINLWISETNREYLLDKVEMTKKEISSGDIKFKVRYILVATEDNVLKYYSHKEFNTFWSTSIEDVILYNSEYEAEEQKLYAATHDNMKVSLKKIKIDYIY